MNDNSFIQETIEKYISSLLSERLRVLNKGFNFDELKSFKSYRAMNEYANKYLEFAGTGDGRRVYILSSKKVIKIAQNSRGCLQNQAEVESYQKTAINTELLFPRIFDYDRNRPIKWVLMELVRPIYSEKEFRALSGGFSSTTLRLFDVGSGLSPEEAINDLQDKIETGEKDIFKKYSWVNHDDLVNLHSLQKNPLFRELLLAISQGILDEEDLDWTQFGRTTENKLVLFDFGMNKQVGLLYK